MVSITRRVFVRRLAARLGTAVGSWVLTACGQANTYGTITNHIAPPVAKDLPYLVVARGGDQPEELVKRTLAALGGIERFVAGMKNLMGLMLERQAMHFNIGQRTADLASGIPLTLTVFDAVRTLRENGPTGGNLNDVKKLDTVIASPDVVAADSYAATLLDMQPDDVPYIAAAAKMGIGRSDLANLKIEEVPVS